MTIQAKDRQASQKEGSAIPKDRPEPSLRAPLRPQEELSPTERARIRATQIRENLGGAIDQGEDKFAVIGRIPEGWTYEWKRLSVLGKVDHIHMADLSRKGWEPVPAQRHPEMATPGNDSTIEREGMILMERPKEITDEARNIELRVARDQVRVKEQQLGHAPEGQFDRSNKSDSLAKVKKSYERIDVPEDDE